MKDWIKILIIPLLALVFLIASTAVVFNPGRVEIKKSREQLAILLGQGDRLIPEYKIVKEESTVDSLRAIVKDMKDRLYPVAEFAELGRAIENSGKRFNLKLVTLTPDYSKLNLIRKEGEEITELPITIQMQGKFIDFAHYIEKLSEFPYVKATEINLARNVELGNNIEIEIKGIVVFKNKLSQEPVQSVKPVSAQT